MKMMIKVGPCGDEIRGIAWDEKGQSMLTQIFISCDNSWFRSIQIAYILNGKLQLSNKHGGNGEKLGCEMFKTIEIDYLPEFITGISGYYGTRTQNVYALKSLCNQPKKIEIDYHSEFITGITGSYCNCSKNVSALNSLTFETNRRKFGPFGKQEGKYFCIQMGTNQRFGGSHGSSDSYNLYSVEVYMKPIHPIKDTMERQSSITYMEIGIKLVTIG
ncbi:inactive protein RESTRICTED TEV MOVEMENT 1-like [Macadamia integrifolia]|uniref:inactive protein RESTRICTED TEV MOVEMENT 1-like n=1 Tax=Macadamia integrifolia TaxID=60698 RepID=UPI001C4E3D2D|nr:inactive protein RESTRICTED TEV MOVEMENT 1-like [Macadamia integrifolia]